MELLERLKFMLRADAHGMVDALQDRALLLKQHLRDAELEVQHKRGQLERLKAAQQRLEADRERLRIEHVRHERDVELALSEDQDELARSALGRSMSVAQLLERVAQRIEDNCAQCAALELTLTTQRAELELLRARVEQELSALADSGVEGVRGEAGPTPIAPDELELELLRRKRSHTGGDATPSSRGEERR